MPKRILWGVCGIGNGHAYRQLPLIERFADRSRIAIFTYGAALPLLARRFAGRENVRVIEVAVPFYVGSRDGLDMEATAALPANHRDFDSVNVAAAAAAREFVGIPNLAVSDYEPETARYAYSCSTPLVTVDQQSKYLVGDFPAELRGATYADEVARLRLFFPSAAARIACSFFDVPRRAGGEDVTLVPPILRSDVLRATRQPKEGLRILIYISAQQPFPQSLNEILDACRTLPSASFSIFAPGESLPEPVGNVRFLRHGDPDFNAELFAASGIVSTAGHSLLSEAMHLGIPVLALPLPVYEQQMNAEVIRRERFGLLGEGVTPELLREFVERLPEFAATIRDDRNVLLRGDGTDRVTGLLESFLA